VKKRRTRLSLLLNKTSDGIIYMWANIYIYGIIYIYLYDGIIYIFVDIDIVVCKAILLIRFYLNKS